MKISTLKTLGLSAIIGVCAPIQAQEWQTLIDTELSQFDVWMGIPHSSVNGLPEGTFQSDKVTEGQALGLNNDPLKVFSVAEENGQPILKISGQIYGGLTSKKEFENYHLKMQFRFGFTRWEPRLDKKRDSGLLYHCQGPHGVFWQTWKACLEYQIQESDIGDYLALKGPRATYRGFEVDPANKPDKRDQSHFYYDPNSETTFTQGRYTNALIENDAPLGNWNTVELMAVGTEAVHLVNGEVVMFIENIQYADRRPLTKGQIQIQSEAAEIDYRDMKIRTLNKFPDWVEKQIRRVKN